MKIRELQKCTETITGYKNSKYADKPTNVSVCPVCGMDLSAFPHTEQECAEWFAEDYRDADETRADLWQF